MASEQFAKDCGCVTHDGPHWLHMDEMWRERNQEHRQRFDDAVAAGEHESAYWAGVAFAKVEAERLAELGREMAARGVERIPEEVRERVRASRAKYIAARRAEFNRGRASEMRAAEARLAEAATEYETATAERRAELADEIAVLQQALARKEAACPPLTTRPSAPPAYVAGSAGTTGDRSRSTASPSR